MIDIDYTMWRRYWLAGYRARVKKMIRLAVINKTIK